LFKTIGLLISVLSFAVATPATAATAKAGNCSVCGVSQERCTANCLGREDDDDRLACLMACDNAAATCSCDEPVTLRSEDVVGAADGGPSPYTQACHSTTPCPPEYSSCASWSSYVDCDDPWCGVYRYCPDPPYCESGLCFGPALEQNQERYRVCFNQQSDSCTEYQRTTVRLGCGC
jgi:hypothetical protein